MDLGSQSGVSTNTSHFSYKRKGEFLGSIPSMPQADHWKTETGSAPRFFKQINGPKEGQNNNGNIVV